MGEVLAPRRKLAVAFAVLVLAGGALGTAVAASAQNPPPSEAHFPREVRQEAPSEAHFPREVRQEAPSEAHFPREVRQGGAAREGFAPSLALPPGAAAEPPAVLAATPVSVAVPRIGVDTPLVDLGIAADGSLEVPGRDQFDLAGWLTTSAVPGQPGAGVIAGHVDSTSGPAVFFRLEELVAGDEVVVTLDDGAAAVFTVDAVRRVSKDAFPTAEVYGPQPGSVLRLVTCGGAFDTATGHYEDNVIAFASLA